MSEKTAPETAAPARKRGARPAAETGRVTAVLGAENYSKLNDLRWEHRAESVSDFVNKIVAEWCATH